MLDPALRPEALAARSQASTSRGCAPATAQGRRADHAGTRRRMPHSAHQRTQYGRKNSVAEDGGAAGPDGASRVAGSMRAGGAAGIRAGAGGYRRQPIHPGKPEHIFFAYLAHSGNGSGRDAGFPRAAGRAGRRYRSGRRRSAGCSGGGPFPRSRRVHAGFDAPAGTQNLRSEHWRGAQRVDGLR